MNISSAYYCKRAEVDIKKSVCSPDNADELFLSKSTSKISFDCKFVDKEGDIYYIEDLGSLLRSETLKIAFIKNGVVVDKTYTINYEFNGEHIKITIDIDNDKSDNLAVKYDIENQSITLIVELIPK